MINTIEWKGQNKNSTFVSAAYECVCLSIGATLSMNVTLS